MCDGWRLDEFQLEIRLCWLNGHSRLAFGERGERGLIEACDLHSAPGVARSGDDKMIGTTVAAERDPSGGSWRGASQGLGMWMVLLIMSDPERP